MGIPWDTDMSFYQSRGFTTQFGGQFDEVMINHGIFLDKHHRLND